MAAPFLPNILFYEDFAPSSASGVQPLQACIVGPHAQLVRYGQPSEKPVGALGAYDPGGDAVRPWPGLQVGGKVDLDYTRLFIDDARMVFYTKAQGSGPAATVASASKLNRIALAGSAGFKANGTHPRLSGLNGRDVKLGDRVRVTGVAGGNTYAADSYVTGFDGATDAAVVGSATADAANKATQSSSTTAAQTAGSTNCNSIVADLTNYNGLVDGYISDVYTVSVVQNSVGGDVTTAVLRIRSASGLDDVAAVAPAASGTFLTVGSRGLQIKVVQTSGPCDLLAGQAWQVTANQAFTAATAAAAGTYVGDEDDTYVVTITRGGQFADSDPARHPQWTVTTVKGLDSSGPYTVAAANTAYPIGVQGVTLKFPTGLAGVCRGDRFYVPVSAAKLGVINTLVLANAMPSELVAAADLTLQLYAQKSVEVPHDRAGFDPLLNFSAAPSGVTVYGGIVLYDPEFVDGAGAPLPMAVIGGSLYVQYRAWLPALASSVGVISDSGSLGDLAPGAIDPDNPLTYNLSRALLTANGSGVLFIAVADPTDPSSWSAAVGRLRGRADVYDIVPLTYDPAIVSLFVAHVASQSSPEEGLERRLVIGLRPTLAKQLVGPGTTTDRTLALATASDDPDSAGTQYTLLTSANAAFLANGVRPGDEVRYLYTSSFGRPAYSTFVVSRVASEESLIVTAGVGQPVGTAQRIEVWHNNSLDEVVADLKNQAADYASARTIAIWSDLIGLDAPTTEAYSIASAVAGQMSGVLPQQGLTNSTIPGFADVVADRGLLTEDQIADLAGNGVWVVSRTPRFQSNAVITRLATTTAPDDITTREEMIGRNLDSMIKFVRNRLSVYLQGTNVTPSAASLLRVEVDAAHAFLKSSGFTQALGGQLIDGVLNSIRQHVVFADRYVIDVTWTIPVPLNTIEFHIAVVTSAPAA